jgi:hypothetical protein
MGAYMSFFARPCALPTSSQGMWHPGSAICGNLVRLVPCDLLAETSGDCFVWRGNISAAILIEQSWASYLEFWRLAQLDASVVKEVM